MKLFRVRTTMNEFGGCKDVRLVWFHASSNPPRRPYELVIENYVSCEEHAPARCYIDELFTEIEAAVLKRHLDQAHGHQSVTEIEQVKLPIPNTSMWGVRGWPVGGGDGFYELSEENGYSAPFKVEGYFSLVGCELIDGSDVYHHRHLLVFPNGEPRMQTNAEAAARLVDHEVPF